MSSPNTNISFFYEFNRVILGCFFSTFYDFSASGAHHIPKGDGVIFATNHTSFYDPPVVGLCVQRPLNYFARHTLFKGLFGKFIRSLNAIPVNRDAADIKSVKTTLNVLKNNGTIMIFPEGTRSTDGKLQEPEPGTGMIACKSKAIVIPTRIFGNFEIFGRHKKLPVFNGAIHVSFGSPMLPGDLDPGREHPDRYLEASRRIMQEIAKLKPPAPVIV